MCTNELNIKRKIKNIFKGLRLGLLKGNVGPRVETGAQMNRTCL